MTDPEDHDDFGENLFTPRKPGARCRDCPQTCPDPEAPPAGWVAESGHLYCPRCAPERHGTVW